MIPVHVVGVGISMDNLTPKALEIIQSAQVLVGGRRLLGYFPDHPGRKIPLGPDLKGVRDCIRDLAASHRVVVLASGDPNFYGIGPWLVRVLGEENVVIHPNITAVQAAFARLKMTWQDAKLISLHGRGWDVLNEAIRRSWKLAIYTDSAHTPAHVAQFLMEQGWTDARMCVIEDLGQDTERIAWFRPEEAAKARFSDLNLIVVLREEVPLRANERLHLGMPEKAFVHEAGLITKAEVRAVVLAKLALLPGQIVWDLGAGCGSVGLEASLLVPGGRILAVERDPKRAAQIRLNGERLGVRNLEVVCGEAPTCLEGLPIPDRVFVGGGGQHLEAILQKVLHCIPSHGRIVMTATLMETLQLAQGVLQRAGWKVDLTHLQVSRSRSLGQGIGFQALNPVWIIAGGHGERYE
jgi:precorrin-6Y C5,15-methyltransferase (decarboxylating)